LIAAMRNALPELLDAVAASQAREAMLVAALEQAREACRSNLVYATRKNEEVLLDAFHAANDALSGTSAAATAMLAAVQIVRDLAAVGAVAKMLAVKLRAVDLVARLDATP
jgi:hypothetical protein